jgi:phage FluMu protein Com
MRSGGKMMGKNLTNDTLLGYDYVSDRCACGRAVLLRKHALVVGELFVKCPQCKKWVRISDIKKAEK